MSLAKECRPHASNFKTLAETWWRRCFVGEEPFEMVCVCVCVCVCSFLPPSLRLSLPLVYRTNVCVFACVGVGGCAQTKRGIETVVSLAKECRPHASNFKTLAKTWWRRCFVGEEPFEMVCVSVCVPPSASPF